MKKLIYLLFILFLVIVVYCQPSVSQKDLQITYIANEGFLISSGNNKVLIDGLFKSKHYTSPSDSTIARLINRTAPLDNIDYFLVTHDHQDHFSEKLTSEFLQKNPKTKFISTLESCNRLGESGFKDGNTICIYTDIGELKEISEIKNGNFSLSALRLKHGTSTDINNLAFIIRINDFNIMHMGDAFILQNQEYLEKINWDNFKIDVLFLGYMDVQQFTLDVLSKTIKPKNIIMMHIHEEEIQEAKERNNQYSANAVIFEKELETKTFTK